MNAAPQLILVTGATGAQGGATARALIEHGHRVRILSRNPASPAAQILARSAEVLRGDFDDPTSVMAALRGVAGVFSVQIPDTRGTDSERRHGLGLVQAASQSGVRQFVHTSVTGTDRHREFPRWGTGYWMEKYWTDKWEIEEAVRSAGFASWTVLKPAFLMENFAHPKAKYMFPDLRHGEIATALNATTHMQLITAEDVGRFARAAFDEPAAFHRYSIDLAAEALTMPEVASILTRVLETPISAIALTPEAALTRRLSPGWVRSQEWTNEIGYRADIDALKRYGIALTRFEQWARQHREQIRVETKEARIGPVR